MSKFKSFIKKNGKKIAIGVGVVALAGTAGYRFIKLYSDNTTLKYDRDTLMAAASECLYDEAIATTTRKLNWVSDAIKLNKKRLDSNPNDVDAITKLEEYKAKFDVLSDRYDRFTKAKSVYDIYIEE